ncbi:hypothetical protein DOY81_000121, partial [Sarcophaga bullata]
KYDGWFIDDCMVDWMTAWIDDGGANDMSYSSDQVHHHVAIDVSETDEIKVIMMMTTTTTTATTMTMAMTMTMEMEMEMDIEMELAMSMTMKIIEKLTSTASIRLNCNYNCRLGHDNMAAGGGDYPHNTTNSPSPSSLYSSCPQLNQYRSLPRNLFSALRRQEQQLPHNTDNLEQPQQNYPHLCGQHYAPRTNSEQELRRSAFIRSITTKNKNQILCSKCAVLLEFSTPVVNTPATKLTSASEEYQTIEKSLSEQSAADILPLPAPPGFQDISIATSAALTTQRILCENCRYNNQPVVWWVSCPRLANQQGSTQSLKEYTTYNSPFLRSPQNRTDHNVDDTTIRSEATSKMLQKSMTKSNVQAIDITTTATATATATPTSSRNAISTPGYKYNTGTVTNATPSPPPPPLTRAHHHPPDSSCIHQFEDQDSGFPGLRDQEFYLLHRNIPALRRTGVDTIGIRQHFYPDGGWGWIICGMSFLVHILTTGLQLSYGLTLFYAVQHIKNANGNEWLGALSWSISMLISPFVETICRRKSTRLLAVVGGLITSLGILFTSFATEVDQVIFSYGFVFGIGVAMVRETSTIMLGNYFKKRRLFVEMVAMSGEGVGIALFSVLLKEGVGKMGWRSGLQIVAALTSISFFVGLLYRPASLYHPQRRAIQHLKNQRKKLRDHKNNNPPVEPNILKKLIQDISNLKSGTVKILLLTSAVAALGIYTPMFTMSLNAAKEGSDIQELVLLQTMLGMSTTLGIVLAGVLIRRPFVIHNFVLSTPIVSQFFLATVALSILFMSFVMGYKGLCILSGIYGVGFGGFRFTLKMLALERIKVKFSKTWSFIRGIEAIPVLISVPLTIFLNDYSLKYGRAGYYICSAAAAIAAIIIFFIGYSTYPHTPSQRSNINGAVVPTTPRMRSMSTQYVRNKFQPAFTVDYPKSNGCDYPAPDILNRSCISLNQLGASSSCVCEPIRSICSCHHHRLTPSQQRRHFISDSSRVAGGGVGPLHAAEVGHDHCNPYIYDNGTGNYLRRSLSFIQNANCCGVNQFQLQCQANVQWSNRDLRMDAGQPLLCTCSPNAYFQNCKSQSVPEGLSTMSQQCKCKPQSSREYIYVPRHLAHQHQQLQPLRHNCSCHNLDKSLTTASTNTATASILTRNIFKDTAPIHSASTIPKCRLKRSQSLSRPITYVEQMTTSV